MLMPSPGPSQPHVAGTGLTDSFGRVATDLRVSLTDRCNLRCTYCMPPEGLEWLPDDSVLSDDEVVLLADGSVARRWTTADAADHAALRAEIRASFDDEPSGAVPSDERELAHV